MTLRALPPLATAAATLLATAAGAQESITVYTSQPTEQMTTVVEAFNEAHPEIAVEVDRKSVV